MASPMFPSGGTNSEAVTYTDATTNEAAGFTIDNTTTGRSSSACRLGRHQPRTAARRMLAEAFHAGDMRATTLGSTT